MKGQILKAGGRFTHGQLGATPRRAPGAWRTSPGGSDHSPQHNIKSLLTSVVSPRLLAHSSGDSTARIWDLEDLSGAAGGSGGPGVRVAVCKHARGGGGGGDRGEAKGDVTSLDWGPDGSCLATGAFDGGVRLWNTDGGPWGLGGVEAWVCGVGWGGWEPKCTARAVQSWRSRCLAAPMHVPCAEHQRQRPQRGGRLRPPAAPTTHLPPHRTHSPTNHAAPCCAGTLRTLMEGHSSPLFCLRFNRKGDLLLSGGVDKAVIVWEVKSGGCKHACVSVNDEIVPQR